MAGSVIGTFKISVLVNGQLYQMGSAYDPFSLALSGDVVSMSEVNCTAASGGELIATFGTVPLFVVIIPEQDGVLSWRGTADADNSSVKLLAGWPFIFSTGITSADDTTPELRSEAAAQNITQLWYDTTVNGQVRILVGR